MEMANSIKEEESYFETEPGFCPDCASTLPMLGNSGGVKCYTCHKHWGPEVFEGLETKWTIEFNDENTYMSAKKKNQENEEKSDGPVIDRQCPQCNNDKMTYYTLQLRSADEGQTVFYTCTKCKFKERENS